MSRRYKLNWIGEDVVRPTGCIIRNLAVYSVLSYLLNVDRKVTNYGPRQPVIKDKTKTLHTVPNSVKNFESYRDVLSNYHAGCLVP